MKALLDMAELLVGSYRSQHLAVIQAIMDCSDTPMSLRHQNLDALIANKAYLDLNALTRKQFAESTLRDILWRPDVESGLADLMEAQIRRAVAQGGGVFCGRIIGGLKEPIVNDAEIRVINGWVLAALRNRPGVSEITKQQVLYLEPLPTCTIHRIDERPKRSGAVAGSPCQVLPWRRKHPA